MIIERVLKELEEKKQRRLNGKINSIPFGLSRFSTVLPGIEQGRYYNITAGSKVGKSQLCDALFVYNPLDFILNNPNSGIKLKILYFSLEMSKESKVRQLMSYYLFKKTGEIISPAKMQSKFADYILEDSKLEFFKTEQQFFDFFEQYVTIYDNIRNPFGIYKEVRKYAHSHGSYYDKSGNKLDTLKIETGEEKEGLRIEYYKPDDLEEYVVIITDHASLVGTEKGNTQHQSMSKFSGYYMHMRDRWNYTPVLVQQQALEGEKQQFTYKGDSIVSKLKPSPDNLAENKTIGRDCDYMLGLFAPNRFGIKEYDGYDLTKLKDTFRELSIIYSRHSAGSQCIPLLFLGACNYFEELNRPITQQDYDRITGLQQQMKN